MLPVRIDCKRIATLHNRCAIVMQSLCNRFAIEKLSRCANAAHSIAIVLPSATLWPRYDCAIISNLQRILFAVALQSLCNRFAIALQSLCKRFAIVLQLLRNRCVIIGLTFCKATYSFAIATYSFSIAVFFTQSVPIHSQSLRNRYAIAALCLSLAMLCNLTTFHAYKPAF
jgi:hypothetical protein